MSLLVSKIIHTLKCKKKTAIPGCTQRPCMPTPHHGPNKKPHLTCLEHNQGGGCRG
jgi:hypothetical protein